MAVLIKSSFGLMNLFPGCSEIRGALKEKINDRLRTYSSGGIIQTFYRIYICLLGANMGSRILMGNSLFRYSRSSPRGTYERTLPNNGRRVVEGRETPFTGTGGWMAWLTGSIPL